MLNGDAQWMAHPQPYLHAPSVGWLIYSHIFSTEAEEDFLEERARLRQRHSMVWCGVDLAVQSLRQPYRDLLH